MHDESIDISVLRKKAGWSQDRMAEFLGVDRSTVSRMENGAPVSGPVARLLKILSQAENPERVLQ